VYAASEGLSVVVLDTRVIGGRPARVPASKIIWDSRQESQARRLPDGPTSRHRNSALTLLYLFL
jgi:hypothetical protein